MEMIHQTIAKNILAFRKETGLSQLALAINANIALKTLHAIEHADTNCRLRTLDKIVKALGIPVAQFFEERQSSSSKLDLLIALLSQSE